MDEIEKLVAEAIARGYKPDEIQARLKSVGIEWTPPGPMQRTTPFSLLQKLTDKHGHGPLDVAGAALEGATMGVSKHVVPGLEEQQAGFGKDHPVLKGVSNVGGALATAPLWPAKAGMLLRGLAGGGAGAIAAAAEGEDPVKGGAIGAGAGMVLPPIAGRVGRVVKRAAQPFKNPAKMVADATGPLLPPNAAARMAQQEKLAPGASVPASLSPDLPASTRVIGANAPVATAAQEAAEQRLVTIQQSLDNVGGQYNSILGNRFSPLDLGRGKPNIHMTVVKHGMWPGNGTVALQDVQKLRSRLRLKRESAKGMVKHELSQDIKKLSDWLELNDPRVADLDRDYRELMKMKKSGEEVIKNIRQSRKSYASSRAAGIEPGSPGASLPSKGNMFSRIFSPDRSRLAEEADRLLLQPGQIPQELLQARMRAARPYQHGLLAPFVMGGQAPQAMGLFD